MSTFRYAARSLTRARGFAFAIVATIALAIGVGSATFAVVNAVLLRPLPYANADRLVGLWHTMPGLNIPLAKQADGTYDVYREGARSFDAMGLYLTYAATLSYRDPSAPPERVRLAYVTASTLNVLGVRPMVGRSIVESDEPSGAAPVALIGERLWRLRFGGAHDVTDQTIDVDGISRRIIGVMPESFAFPESGTPVWVPLDPNPNGYVGGFGYGSVARLRTGVTIAAAQRELAQLLPRVPVRFPEVRPGIATVRTFEQTRLAPIVHTLRDDVVGEFDRVLWLIAATVAVLVLVAFSNVASLMLVRVESRRRELAVRAALGASTWDVLRSLMAEATIVTLAGGALGVALAAAIVQRLAGSGFTTIPRLGEIRLDASLALVALALAACFAMLCAAIGAASMRSRDTIRLLRDGGRTGTSGRSTQRVRAAFVGVEVALSLVLLASAAVLGRSVVKLRAVQPGFDSTNLFTFWTFLPPTTYKARADAARFYDVAVDRMRRLPGVVNVAATAKLPLEVEGFAYQVLIWADDGSTGSGTLPPVFQATTVTRGYFDTMRIPVVAGRSFDDEHIRRSGALEAVASRGFIEHFWHDSTGRSGVGKRLRPVANGPWFTIVGVVGDVRDSTLTRPPVSAVYFPEEPNSDTTGTAFTTARDMAFVVRTRGPIPGLPQALARELHALDPNLPIYRPAAMEQIVEDARAPLALSLAILTAGAIATLLLGVVGLSGVITYAVSLRTREIGIRIALGLDPAGASRMLARQGAAIIAVGAVAGLAAFLAFARLIASLSFEVRAVDAPSLASAVVLVLGVSSIATWLPARRAARVDPAEALRAD